jgi:hypothetical protein
MTSMAQQRRKALPLAALKLFILLFLAAAMLAAADTAQPSASRCTDFKTPKSPAGISQTVKPAAAAAAAAECPSQPVALNPAMLNSSVNTTSGYTTCRVLVIGE